MRVGPKYKIARRLGESIFSKTQTPRFAMVEGKKKTNISKKRKHRSNLTEYGIQFLEKQKIRLSYGLTEKQLSNIVKAARKKRSIGINITAAQIVYRDLESRIDNTLYRLGLAPTRASGRQMVTHGHVLVNNKKVNSPSYSMNIADRMAISSKGIEGGLMRGRAEKALQTHAPTWLALDEKTLEGTVLSEPKLGEQDSHLNFGILVQFYSRV